MMLPDEPLPLSKQKLEFCNDSSRTVEVMVELVPNLYRLKPGDRLTLLADAENPPRVEGFTVNLHDDDVQIYAAWDGEPEAYINGQRAQPD